jgi:cleavage stimulation factor subunit 3
MSVAADAPVKDEDRTHSTEDILNTLRQLSNSQQGSRSQTSEPVRSEWEILRNHLRDNPRDVDSWLKLVDVAKDSRDYDRVNETYEALLEAFPNFVSQILAWIVLYTSILTI